MTDNTPIVINESETTETPAKESWLKKIIRNPKSLAIGAGTAVLLIAGAVVFAVSRSDEDDFESEFPEELETSTVEDETV